MNKKKKFDKYNLLAALSSLLSFVMMIVLIAYYMSEKTSQLKTIILFFIFGLSIVCFIVFTVLYFRGAPNLKNKK